MARGHQRGPFLVPSEHRASLRGCFVCHWRWLHHSGWVSLCRPQTQSPPDFHASTAPHAGASHSFVHSSLRSSCSWSFWEIGQIAPCLKSLLVFSVSVSVLPSLSLPRYSLSVTAEGKHHITPQPVCTVYPPPPAHVNELFLWCQYIMLHPRDGLAGGLQRPELLWDVTGRRQLAKGGRCMCCWWWW